MKKPDKKPAETIKMVTVATLDAGDLYQGTQEISEDELTDAHIHLPNGCDLPIGKYRFDRERKTFIDAKGANTAETPAPNASRAIAISLIALHEQGLPLPLETLAWLDYYTSSIDFLGNFSQETVQMVKKFQTRNKG